MGRCTRTLVRKLVGGYSLSLLNIKCYRTIAIVETIGAVID